MLGLSRIDDIPRNDYLVLLDNVEQSSRPMFPRGLFRNNNLDPWMNFMRAGMLVELATYRGGMR